MRGEQTIINYNLTKIFAADGENRPKLCIKNNIYHIQGETMANYNPKSLKAEEFINDGEIRATLEYAEAKDRAENSVKWFFGFFFFIRTFVKVNAF